MSSVTPLLADVLEQTPVYIMMLVVGGDNTPVVQADLSAVVYKTFDMTTSPPTQIVSASQTISAVIFDTLQTPTLDPRWTRDATGYNYGALFPANTFPSGIGNIRIEINFTPNGGEQFTRRVDCRVAQLYSR